MLSRKAMLILLVLVLVMLVGDIWQVTHGIRWSIALFAPPVVVMSIVVAFVEKERAVVASANAIADWKKWGGAFGVSIAMILTVGQLLPVFPSLGITLPSSELIYRLFVASCGLAIVVIGNHAPKLPPLVSRRPGLLSLGTAGQVAMSRFLGWLLVSSGVTITVSAFLPWRTMGLAMTSVALAVLIAVLTKRLQLQSQN